MYRSAIGQFICLILILWGGVVWSSPLRVAQDLWPPYVMNSVLGSGIAHDLVTDGLVSSGYEVEYSVKPWSRVLKETINGKNDVIIAIWKTEQRNKDYLFTDVYMYNQMAFVYRSDTKFEYVSQNSLKGKRVALINNYGYGAGLREFDGLIPIDSIDLPNSIRLVMTDRADVLVTDEAVGRWTVKEMRIKKGELYFSTTYLDSTPLHAAVRRDHPQAKAIVSALNRYFREHAAQKLEQLRVKYGLTD
ncbi:transporter substrate-binding domain-containing protein [Vibrio sp. Isolate24]|uniref:substrate-binding periplasmic protein n=1 Tax=unclassified Vibrio TaxID=2614977 RepID=UPI0031F33599